MELFESLLAVPVSVNQRSSPIDLLRLLEWQKADKIYHFAKLGELLYTILHFLQSVANSVGLMHHFEETQETIQSGELG